METVQSLLARKLRDALFPNAPGAAAPRVPVTPTNDARFGDYQTNVAMVLAREAKANPRQLAQQIIDKLDVSEMCEPPEIAGAGFINFRLKREWIESRLAELAADAKLGVPAPSWVKTLVVDFSSPNVAKPMHVGHIRSTFLGDAISRIAAFVGHKVIRDNHIGDWGTQFGMLLHGWKTVLNKEALAADPLSEMERIYKLISAKCKEAPATLEQARQELVKLQNGDAENLALWHEMIRLSQAQFDTIYGRLGVKFDVTLGESFYNPQLKDVVQQLRDKGIAQQSGGAWCVFSDHTLPEKEDPFLIQRDGEWVPIPAIVQKADGAANYTTTDLATIEYRLKTWTPDEIVYVTDDRQQHHFRQLFSIFRRWQPGAKTHLSHVWFGKILGDDGKPFKTRSGENVKLAELLDEAEERAYKIVAEKNPDMPEPERRGIARIIGLGAVKYADLVPARHTDYVFSWDKMLSLHGNTAPYLQNAYVRIQSIFRKANPALVLPSNFEIVPEIKAADRWGAIAELVDALVAGGKIQAADREAVLESLRAREETMSTGIGFGIAIPHAISDRVGEVTGAFGISSGGIEFDSLDGATVRFIVLFIVPKGQFQANLDMLGTVAKFLNNRGVCERLFGAHSSAEITAVLDGRGPVALPEKFTLAEPAEIALAKKLFQFGEIVPLVLEDYRPNILANYLYELANTFHTFYEACPVLKSEEPARSTRLALCDLTARVLRQGLGLLGIEVPDRM